MSSHIGHPSAAGALAVPVGASAGHERLDSAGEGLPLIADCLNPASSVAGGCREPQGGGLSESTRGSDPHPV